MEWILDLKRNPTNYNFFFHPNICHICKMPGRAPLKVCPKCNMISYCHQKHMELHQPQHMDLCQAICHTTMKNVQNTRGLTSIEWILFQWQNVQTVKQILRRELEPYEEQMFFFAKSCGICRQQRDLTATCRGCFSVNTCANHELADVRHDCKHLEITLWLECYNIGRVLHLTIPSIYLPICENNDIFPDCMRSFIQLCRNHKNSEYSLAADDYIYCDYLSDPLTLYSAMKHVQFLDSIKTKNSIIIHVISGYSMKMPILGAWEMLLHALNARTNLTIVMVGPKLQHTLIQISRYICQNCKDTERMLNFEFHSMLYETYAQHHCFTAPNVIVGFHVGLKHWKINGVRALRRSNCPLILTAALKDISKEDIVTMKKVFNVEPIADFENKFKSYRPQRFYENELHFRNARVVIYCWNDLASAATCTE